MTTPLYRVEDGWLTEACGRKVNLRKQSPQGASSSWPGGHAKGVFLHYQAGCGEELTGLYQGQGYTEANYSIGRGGAIYGYLPLDRSGDHAYAASQWGYGIEHAALPGTCDLNEEQFQSSIRLSAALVAWLKDERGHTVPLKHIGGCNLTDPGFKEHKDGAIPEHCSWNPGVHVDDPGTRWGWQRYLDGVEEILGGGEDLNDTEHNWLEWTKERLYGLIMGIKGDAEPEEGKERKQGWTAGNVVRSTRQFQQGYDARVKGKTRPTDAEQAQGWDAADWAAQQAGVDPSGAHNHGETRTKKK